MNTVFVVQNPAGKNLLPATEFGELRIILKGSESNKIAYQKLLNALSRMGENDYVLLIGKPLYIGMAVHLAVQLKEGLSKTPTFLTWDRDNYKYRKETVFDERTNKSIDTAASR